MIKSYFIISLRTNDILVYPIDHHVCEDFILGKFSKHWKQSNNFIFCKTRGKLPYYNKKKQYDLSSPPSANSMNAGFVHVENFSRIYANNPTGESFNATPKRSIVSLRMWVKDVIKRLSSEKRLTNSVRFGCLNVHIAGFPQQGP